MAISNTKPVHIIVNPRSGYGSQKLLLADMNLAIRQAGYDIVQYITKAPLDATAYARKIQGQASAVVVWGGDGTVNEVANGLGGSDIPIIPCQAGTENLLAKELKIPRNPYEVAQLLTTGKIVQCDIGSINGKSFLLIIGIGFDGEVVRRLSQIRKGHISHLSYFWPIWRTFWEHDFPKMRIVADGQEIFNDYGLAFVGNISRYAVGLRICRDALYDDGMLDLVVFSCREQATFLLHAGWTLLRRHPLKGNVIYKRIKNVRFETDRPVPSQVDGDPGPWAPLDISVLPIQIKLLIPGQQEAWGFWPFIGERT